MVINVNAAVTLLEQQHLASRGFDSSVGIALHRHHRGRGFESRSEPENFFQVSVPVVLRPHLH